MSDVSCSYSIYAYSHTVLGTIVEGPSSVTYIPGLTPLPIELKCNCTGVVLWRVNKRLFTPIQITKGILPGHNLSGKNILVNSPVNNTEYICLTPSFTTGLHDIYSDPAYIVFAGKTFSCVAIYVSIDDTKIFQFKKGNRDQKV